MNPTDDLIPQGSVELPEEVVKDPRAVPQESSKDTQDSAVLSETINPQDGAGQGCVITNK